MATKVKTEKTISESQWYPLFLDKADDSKTDEQKAANWVIDRRRAMAAQRANYETQWTLNEKNWRVEEAAPDGENDWRSTHTTPLTHSITETIVAEYNDSEPDAHIIPGKDANEDKAEKINKIVTHSKVRSDYDAQKQIATRDIVLHGTGIWWEYYREDPRTIKELEDFDENTNEYKYKIIERTEFNDVYGQQISLWDFYGDERSYDMSSMRDCIRREVLSMDEFRRLYGKYETVSDGKIMGVSKADLDEKSKVKPGGEVEQKEPYPRQDSSMGDEVVEVLHYFNKPNDIYWIVANEVLVNSFMSPLPFVHKELPFAIGHLIKLSTHLYGVGVGQILAGVQAELDTLRRLRLDRSKLNISKVFLTSGRTDLTDDEVDIYPGKRIQVDDVDKSIKPLDFSDTGASSFKEEESLLEDARWASGISNPSQGVTTGATATESAIVKESTLKRVRTSLKLNSCTFFKRIGQLRLANILQHYTDPIRVNKVTGKDGTAVYEAVTRQIQTQTEEGTWKFINILPEDVRGEYEYYVESYSNIPLSEALEEQKADAMYDRLSLSPVVKPDKLTKWYVKRHKYDYKDFLFDNLATPGPELADEENERMLQGVQLPPTMNALPEHTERHLQFVEANAFYIDDNVDKVITDHINGELNPVSPAGQGNPLPPVDATGTPMGLPPVPGESGALPPVPGGMTGPSGGAQQTMGSVDMAGIIPQQENSGGNPMTPDASFDQNLSQPGSTMPQ